MYVDGDEGKSIEGFVDTVEGLRVAHQPRLQQIESLRMHMLCIAVLLEEICGLGVGLCEAG